MTVRCVQGDATSGRAWAEALQGHTAQALISDPPYCLLTRRRKGGDERDKKQRKIDRGPVRRFEDVKSYRAFTREWMSQAVKHLAPSAPLVLWTNLLGREPITTVARELGWVHQRGEFVWGKRTREGNSGEEILRVVETALVFTREAAPPFDATAPALPWAVVAGYDDEGEAKRWVDHPNH
jgi:site-specific DNA-methyltransferase (adenine-specific)